MTNTVRRRRIRASRYNLTASCYSKSGPHGCSRKTPGWKSIRRSTSRLIPDTRRECRITRRDSKGFPKLSQLSPDIVERARISTWKTSLHQTCGRLQSKRFWLLQNKKKKQNEHFSRRRKRPSIRSGVSARKGKTTMHTASRLHIGHAPS